MESHDVKQVLEQIRPLLQLAGGDLELVDVDERHHSVLVKLILPVERCRRPVVAELRALDEEIRRRDPSIKSVAVVEATPDAK
jgi:Fe-S cluster biogenesis protein NfuA